jgi:trimethylamine--corrinoid protein Co-methyltransferase
VKEVELKGLNVLSGSEVEEIYQGAIKVLSKVGIFIESKSALSLLSLSGIKVDSEKQVAFFSKKQVEDAIDLAPKKISLFSRKGDELIKLGSRNLYCVSGQTANYIIDIKTGERREGILQDVADFTRLSDSLENISAITPAVVAHDVPGSTTVVNAFKEMIINSSKPFGLDICNGESCRAAIEMAKITLQGVSLKEKPFLFIQAFSTSPLSWETGAFDVIVESVKENIPLTVGACPMAGMTAPMNLAGFLIQHLAESLSGLVMGQIIKKGCPIMLSFCPLGFDMLEGVASIANPESVLCRIATSQIGQAIGIPIFNVGLDSDSHCLDEQMAWEKTLTLISLLNSGSNFFVNAGLFSAGLTISLVQLVIDNEIFGICKRLLEGIQVKDPGSSVDLIAKVGPKKHYLEERQTLIDLKKEYYLEKLSKAMSYDRWKAKIGKTFEEFARDRALELIKTHMVTPLPDGVKTKLTEFVNQFVKEVNSD